MSSTQSPQLRRSYILNLNGSNIFTKLDLKMVYHQLELDEKSRDITTFVTHVGVYMKLLFCVQLAAEQYQYEIQKVISGIEGTANISDDIIIHAPDQRSHDKRLREVMLRLKKCGWTLNINNSIST